MLTKTSKEQLITYAETTTNPNTAFRNYAQGQYIKGLIVGAAIMVIIVVGIPTLLTLVGG